MSKTIILYGLGGAEKQYMALCYWCIYEKDISIANIVFQANMMRENNPNIKAVYAIDNRYGLLHEYRDSIKKHTIESCFIFKDTLEREGFRIA